MRCGKCEKELYACKCVKKKDEPVIDRTMAVRIATQLGWEPKREWVGITSEEIAEIGKIWLDGNRMLPFPLARAIEAKLKEKNT